MKTFIIWMLKVLVWILLYYVIISKLITWLDKDLLTIPGMSINLFYGSCALSFSTSFMDKIFNSENFYIHIMPLIGLLIVPCLVLFFNIIIWILNILTNILSIEVINYIILDYYDPNNNLIVALEWTGLFFAISMIITFALYDKDIRDGN